MSNQTKIIIITSNEDLIQQLKFNKVQDTEIFNFEDKESALTNKNLANRTFLAELSEPNSKNNQISTDALDACFQSRPKATRTCRRDSQIICVVCGDHAIGFNYDVLTCASCKAFFRRNAQYNPKNIRCRTGQSRCLISHELHRKCQRCRLEKCLSVGMRRDFIVTEEEKQIKRKRLQENQQLLNERQTAMKYVSQSMNQIDCILMDVNGEDLFPSKNRSIIMKSIPNKTLSISGWSDIENIRKYYLLIFPKQCSSYRSFDVSDHLSALASWSEFASKRAIKLIQFFQQLDEFGNLNPEDRFTLIKYNLLSVYLFQKCLDFDIVTGSFSNDQNEDISKRSQFFKLCYGTSGIRETYMPLIRSICKTTELDFTLIYFLLVILLFSKGLSMSDNEPLLNDALTVSRVQSRYTRLIWEYLVFKQGETKTSIQFSKLLSDIAKIQSFTKLFRDYFHAQIQSTNLYDRIAPIMQSILYVA